jgi:hypothetical protein
MQRSRSILLGFALSFAAGCASNTPVHKEKMVDRPIVVPTAMCAQHGTVAMSNDKTGDRMVCELQEPLGSHMSKCICWDEGLVAQQREETQQIHRQMETGIQTCNGSCGTSI